MHCVCMIQTIRITNPAVLQKIVGKSTLFPDFIRFCMLLGRQKRIFLQNYPFYIGPKEPNK